MPSPPTASASPSSTPSSTTASSDRCSPPTGPPRRPRSAPPWPPSTTPSAATSPAHDSERQHETRHNVTEPHHQEVTEPHHQEVLAVVGRVPLLVPPADRLQGARCCFLARIRAKPVLAGAASAVLHPFVPEAIPPLLLIVHAIRLPDHGNHAPARPDIAPAAGASAYPQAGVRGQETPEAR